jgi:EAL domain-containing protein (putative c-di-GMP-specific phosphodiesterase class I)
MLTSVPGRRLVLEVTEHAEVADYETLVTRLRNLRETGCRIAVDDAGAGYASLRHILRLRPDYIKLDMTLTQGVDRDPDRRALASSLLTFAREVSATVIAEGIETEAELEVLRGLGVTLGQGYYLARPQTIAALHSA